MLGKSVRFEKKVKKLLKKEIDAGRLPVPASAARLFHRKGYYSRDRKKDIVFDVSIEITRPGATSASILWIWECKNYTHPVPVDDAEEFESKLSQIGGAKTKGTIITSGAKFQQGTINFAKSKGIGLVRLVPPTFLYVAECRLPASPSEQQAEYRRGLLAGLPASRDCDAYTMNSAGVYAADFEDFFVGEASDISKHDQDSR